MDEICGLIEKERPDLVVIDSIQTMRCADISSSSGTVSQVKESTARLLAVAKKQEIPMFLVGHVNKDGAIAGPKVMEHIVDTVLCPTASSVRPRTAMAPPMSWGCSI